MQIHELRLPFFLRPRLIPIDIDLRIPIQLLSELVQFFNPIVLD